MQLLYHCPVTPDVVSSNTARGSSSFTRLLVSYKRSVVLTYKHSGFFQQLKKANTNGKDPITEPRINRGKYLWKKWFLCNTLTKHFVNRKKKWPCLEMAEWIQKHCKFGLSLANIFKNKKRTKIDHCVPINLNNCIKI